ncbi:MAG: DcaP family trimeric outer membrane transporter [Desulfurobacteriaceae bacterium]
MRRVLTAGTVALLALSPAAAQDEVEQLKEQIKQLQEQMAKLRARLVELEAKQGKGAKAVTGAKSAIKIYGKVKLDAIYDTHNMGKDQFITYLPKGAGEDKSTFNMKDTRLGFIIDGPEVNGWKVTGRIESDFYGKGGDDNGAFRIRLSYVNLNNGQGTNIRIGQDYIPIASQMASTLDFLSMGASGNLWDRVPQVTVTQTFSNGFGILGTVWKSASTTDGVDMRMPWVGAKAFYKGDIFGTGKPLYIALGGAYRQGSDEIGVDTDDDKKADKWYKDDVSDYLVAVEWNIPFNLFIPMGIKGEAYYGQGLTTRDFLVFTAPHYLDKNEVKELETKGGFVQLSMKPFKKVAFNFGAGMNDPDNDGADALGTYEKNWRAFGNVLYKFAPGVTFGLELDHQETLYKGDVEHGNRLMASAIYVW